MFSDYHDQHLSKINTSVPKSSGIPIKYLNPAMIFHILKCRKRMTSNILEWKEKPKKDICFQEVCLHVYCSQKMVTCDIQLNTAHTKVRLGKYACFFLWISCWKKRNKMDWIRDQEFCLHLVSHIMFYLITMKGLDTVESLSAGAARDLVKIYLVLWEWPKVGLFLQNLVKIFLVL